MADIVTPEKRSQMMAGIKGKNTNPEMLVRRGLHRLGLRYRLHKKNLPGKPDLVFAQYKAVIFVHGCFFHGHECHIFKWPKGKNADFWKKKITGNRDRDVCVFHKLAEQGWRIGIVRECSLKGKYKANLEDVIQACRKWLLSNEKVFEYQNTI